jgi:hypothetical protein
MFEIKNPQMVGKVFAEIKVIYVERLPIRLINFKKTADKVLHDKMAAQVSLIQEAKKQLANARTDKDKKYYENKCSALDRQIDCLVYKLYELTPEEIALVESSVSEDETPKAKVSSETEPELTFDR